MTQVRDTVDGDFKKYVEVPFENNSPNRIPSQRIKSAIDVVANLVDKIPETNVKFFEDTYTLNTQRYATPQESVRLETDSVNEMDLITKAILEELRSNGFARPKADRIAVDFQCVTGAAYGGVKALYMIAVTYSLKV